MGFWILCKAIIIKSYVWKQARLMRWRSSGKHRAIDLWYERVVGVRQVLEVLLTSTKPVIPQHNNPTSYVNTPLHSWCCISFLLFISDHFSISLLCHWLDFFLCCRGFTSCSRDCNKWWNFGNCFQFVDLFFGSIAVTAIVDCLVIV